MPLPPGPDSVQAAVPHFNTVQLQVIRRQIDDQLAQRNVRPSPRPQTAGPRYTRPEFHSGNEPGFMRSTKARNAQLGKAVTPRGYGNGGDRTPATARETRDGYEARLGFAQGKRPQSAYKFPVTPKDCQPLHPERDRTHRSAQQSLDQFMEVQGVRPGYRGTPRAGAPQAFRVRGAVAGREAPPRAGAMDTRTDLLHEPTLFRKFYERGDLPIAILHRPGGNKVHWKIDIQDVQNLDLHFYLPMFFDGVREKKDPARFLARTGSYDLLSVGGRNIVPVLPQLILPLRTALNTRDKEVVLFTLKLIQRLAGSHPAVGPALVPYYRQLLPVMNTFVTKRKHMGDRIDYSQRYGMDYNNEIEETLQALEASGGRDALMSIKYIVPTYESCANL